MHKRYACGGDDLIRIDKEVLLAEESVGKCR